MKKFFTKLCVGLITAISIIPSFATYNLAYQNEAKILYDLNLYKGVNEKQYDPDLESIVTREQSAILLVRLFGNQASAYKISDSEAKVILSKFKDANKISDWAKKDVAYCVNCGYIKGIQQDDGLYFNPQGELKGIDYASLILQQLKISNFEYRNALKKLKEEGIISNEQQNMFNKEQLTRDDVVGISYNVLKAKKDDNVTVIESLVNNGIVEKSKAIKYGLIEGETTNPTIPNGPIEKEQPEETTVPPITEQPVITIKPEESNSRRADGAVKLGQWTLYNNSREPINIDKIYLTAVYGGQVYILNPTNVVDYTIEDKDGNIYGDISYVSDSECITLKKPFVIEEILGSNANKKDIYVFAKIKDKAEYGGTIELFLGDNTNIFEATGAITGTKVVKRGEKIAQKNGKKIITITKILPEKVPYETSVTPRAGETVAKFKLTNEGYEDVLLENITLKEDYNTTGNTAYTLRDDNLNVLSKATTSEGKIVFNINTEEIIESGKSREYRVEMDDAALAGSSVQLRLLQDGTCYDSIDNEGYKINIDGELVLSEVIMKY